jgi:cytochrome b subunit of formate dehydrogenase
MGWIQSDQNPWGEEVMIGLAWNVTWLVVAAGAAFVVVHAVFAGKKTHGEGQVDPAVASAVPAEVVRHGKSARLSHWTLAAATLTLLITAFVPMLGLQFPWVTLHWIAGVVLSAYIVYHIVDTTVRMSWGKMMWVGPKEIALAVKRTANFFKRAAEPANRTGKWGTENKVFHHLTALAALGVVATGILMMARVDTPWWVADYARFGFSDAEWGMVFVLHGASAVSFIGLLIAHFYLAARPDKFYLTKSMVTGTITREDYLGHYSPERWPVSENGSGGRTAEAEPAGAGASSSPMDRSRD